MTIKVGVSNHHVHLKKEDLNILFGENYELTNKRDLLQKGQYAAYETVNIEKNGKILENIRIIGPCRSYTQVELLQRDNEYFNINAPVRNSGDLENSESVTIIGPKGKIYAENSTIVANRHLHFSKEDLIKYNREKNEIVKVKVNDIVLDNVRIKSDDTCVLEFHMNKDEAEELKIETGMEVTIC